METNTNETATKARMMDVIHAQEIVRGHKWEPTALAWRLSVLLPCSWQGTKWVTAVFATESEAMTALDATMPKGAYRATVDEAINPASWIDNGRWRKVATRRPTQKAVR